MKRALATVAAAITVAAGGFVAPASADTTIDPVWTYVTTQINGQYAPLVGYFDDDATSDILWYAPGPQADSLWLGRAQPGSFTKLPTSIAGRYVPVVGNFAGDWRDDILWYAPGSAADSLWVATDTGNRFTSRTVSVSGTYAPVVLRDLRSATSHDDVLWHRTSATTDPLWHFADGSTSTTVQFTSSNVAVAKGTTAVVGDWNVDDIDDVFLYGPGSVADARLLSTAAGGFVRRAYSVSGTYRPVPLRGTGDSAQPPFGDAILWWGDGGRRDGYWSNDGTAFVPKTMPIIDWSASVVPFGTGMAIVHLPGIDDFVFFEDDIGPTLGWLSPSGHPSPEGTPVVGDFDGDAAPDIFWYVPGPGVDEVWYLGGTGAAGGASARAAAPSDRPTDWADRAEARQRPTR